MRRAIRYYNMSWWLISLKCNICILVVFLALSIEGNEFHNLCLADTSQSTCKQLTAIDWSFPIFQLNSLIEPLPIRSCTWRRQKCSFVACDNWMINEKRIRYQTKRMRGLLNDTKKSFSLICNRVKFTVWKLSNYLEQCYELMNQLVLKRLRVTK